MDKVKLSEAMQIQAKALADASRFQIFERIATSTDPVNVSDLTAFMGFNHNAIRQHLALLVEAGLVAERDEVRTTRGRPRKLYEARADALDAFSSIQGSHERLAELLLELVSTGATPYKVGYEAEAHATTEPDVEAPRSLLHQLSVDGFEPSTSPDGSISLGHCPFADLAARNPGVVCELHRGLINGRLAATAGKETLAGRLTVADPHQAGCRIDLE